MAGSQSEELRNIRSPNCLRAPPSMALIYCRFIHHTARETYCLSRYIVQSVVTRPVFMETAPLPSIFPPLLFFIRTRARIVSLSPEQQHRFLSFQLSTMNSNNNKNNKKPPKNHSRANRRVLGRTRRQPWYLHGPQRPRATSDRTSPRVEAHPARHVPARQTSSIGRDGFN